MPGCLVCGYPGADPDTFCSGCGISFGRMLKKIQGRTHWEQLMAAIRWAGRRAQRNTKARTIEECFDRYRKMEERLRGMMGPKHRGPSRYELLSKDDFL